MFVVSNARLYNGLEIPIPRFVCSIETLIPWACPRNPCLILHCIQILGISQYLLQEDWGGLDTHKNPKLYVNMVVLVPYSRQFHCMDKPFAKPSYPSLKIFAKGHHVFDAINDKRDEKNSK